MPESPTAVTRSAEPTPPTPPGLRRSAVIALSIGMVAALAAIVVTAVQTSTSEPSSVPATNSHRHGSNQDQRTSATLDPAAATEAAIRYGWQLQDHDEFNGNALGPAWKPYTGPTTDDVGRHDPANLHVANGMLSIVSHGLSSGGLEWAPGQLYGRWEVRARTQKAAGYGDVLILWPDAEDWPVGGEVDFMEIPKPERTEYTFNIHFGADNSENGTKVAGDFTQWHNYAVEWMPDHVAAFVDGQEVFRTTDRRQIPPRSMHLAMQQDIGPFEDWIPPRDATTPAEVHFDIDWVRIYRA